MIDRLQLLKDLIKKQEDLQKELDIELAEIEEEIRENLEHVYKVMG